MSHRGARSGKCGRLVLCISLILLLCCGTWANISILLLCSQRLHPLRIRTHSPLMWDEWYESFIHHAGFLPLAQLINRGPSLMDAAALTALVDRWSPEIHTFHLLSGATTVMLQDVVMILDLPIDDTSVCGLVSPTRWRDSIKEVIGLRPPDIPADQKDKNTMGVHSVWLTTHFNIFPEGAEDAIIQRYVRSCVWRHMYNE
jgi:hypothetical protein